jgi:CDGSH-type Zn-finger protein
MAAMAQSLASSGMKVTILKDGPYRVTGGAPLSIQTIVADEAGESVDWLEQPLSTPGPVYALCRCGHSANKPFCDGAHMAAGFDGTETASRAPYDEQAGAMEGPAVIMTDAESLCAFARFCDREGNVWNTVGEVESAEREAAFVRQVGQCPSGRLVAEVRSHGAAVEPDLPPSIGVVKDPAQGVGGPLWVRGGIEVIGADATTYEVRNRVTLCRCGASNNKPFCDGSHASEAVMFKDD